MKLGQFFFKYRSYTPLPFLLPLVLFARPTMTTLITGFAIGILGELIRFWGVSYAGGETRTRKVGASNLVTQGPFSIIRNPLYFGNIIVYIGVCIMYNSFFPYLLIISFIYFCVQYYFIVVDVEEPHLKESFTEKYEDYSKSVNRFMPGKPYDEAKQSKLKIDVAAGWKSEKRTLQAQGWMLAMVVLLYILSHQ